MQSKSKVTIVIPVYNGEDYIREAIDSALNQDYSNCEIIVVNDGSKDNTEKICKSYGKKIKYFAKENGGVSSALNVAIKHMTGDYFSWLSHDDLYDSNKISKQMKIINKRDDVIIFGDYRFINTRSEYIGEQKIDIKTSNKRYDPVLYGQINGITLLIPKKAIDLAGKFNETLRCTQDYDMWFRMEKKGFKYVHVTDILTSTRLHPGQDTNKNPAVYTEGIDLWTDIIKYYAKLEENKNFNYYEVAAKQMQIMGLDKVVIYCLEQCQKYNPEKTNILKKELVKITKNLNPNVLKRTIRYMKKNGLKRTFKRIVKK